MEGKHKFLHGTLEVSIFRATMINPTFPFMCMPFKRKPTYVTINLGNKNVAKTTYERDRVWNQTINILCAHPSNTTLTIALKTKCTVLGKIHFQGNLFLDGESLIEGTFPLRMDNGKSEESNQKLRLTLMLWFKPAELEPSSSGFTGLKKNVTFPQRSNCDITLYQDAHHSNGFQPPFGKPNKLWEDVYKAIDDSKHLVYIAGWSFNPNLVLVRDPETDIPHARGKILGELLKHKAAEGVAVRIMLWDDKTSLRFIKNKGVMRTHDEDSQAYFKNTKVVCKLVPRSHHEIPSFYTHHQKTIIVDTIKPFSRNREIMSFIGGFDLFDGRYDTEEHSLFHTLNTQSHCYDFYQTSLPGASLHKGGPREPWHDTHSCVLGKAALDVLENFEQRWTKQCDPSFLVPISSIEELNSQADDPISSESRDWNVQVFRSIDHLSTNTLPRNTSVERSIHEGYVEAIRQAQRFIYIENQYFIGGSHVWEQDKNSGCENLIPVEIALKIARKIKDNERFAVYIVIPMWPEGAPESDAVQDILHWSRETMNMMYGIIGEAIRKYGCSETHPRDYLNFFCLANREEEIKGEFLPPCSPYPSSHYWKAQKNRRFMVYVHSKLMIVDDKYMLIGSANVNQRSMDGERDTEIAIGCYQSRSEEPSICHGDIHAYRMSLWYEHTGKAEEEFLEPESLECVKKVYSVGEKMWKIYSSDDVTDMRGVHLVSYPVNITRDGLVEDLMCTDGHFPDTEALVKGKRSKFLSSMITT